MEVRKIMTSDVKTCSPDSTLVSVVDVMWSENVGSVPVVDSGGIVTDQDIAMSSFLNDRSLWELRVQEVVHGQRLWTCGPAASRVRPDGPPGRAPFSGRSGIGRRTRDGSNATSSPPQLSEPGLQGCFSPPCNGNGLILSGPESISPALSLI